jgi:glucose/arabinose dehydrogenase
LKDFKRVFSAVPADSLYQAGSRIEFQGKRYLFLSTGEREERRKVQDPDTDFGKIYRFDLETGDKPEMWAKGVRNPEGLVFDAEGNLWESELGPMGGDEINIIEKGNNYGWPIATYGLAYTGKVIGPPTAEGVTPPVVNWTPSISPSGIAFYYGDKFPRWNGNLFVCTLSGKHLRRLEVKNKKVVAQEVLLGNEDWRFRNVRTGPDGLLYVSTETKIIRLSPLKPGTHKKRR